MPLSIHKCTLCNNFQSLLLRQLLNHYRCVHANEISFSVRCNIDGCPATFQIYNSLYKHVTRKHKDEYYRPNQEVLPLDEGEDIADDAAIPIIHEEEEGDNTYDGDDPDDDDDNNITDD